MIRNDLLKILFVEDLSSDVDLAVLELRKEKLTFEYTTVCTRVDLFKALKKFNPDLIISDYMMPAFSGLQALKTLKEFNPEIPFILCTGSINEETAVECLKAGADDYVIKEHMTRLPFAVKEVLEQHRIQSEKRAAELSLKESEEKFRSIMENSADAIFLTDQQGNYLYTNKAITDMLGYTSGEMIRKTIIDLFPKNKADEYFEIYKQVLNEGKVFTEIELLKKDGNFISTDLNSVLLPGGMVYGSCRDITERKQVQQELIKHRDHLEELINERTEELRLAKKEADEANKAKSEFLANMSHEIRTPMNAVLGYAELLGFTLEDRTQRDYLESIKSSGKSLLTLINDILDLSKIEAGKLELQFEFVSSQIFFSEFERIFSLRISEKGLKFILDISSGTPAGIYIDEARLRQIILNLIGNAIKFTEKGSIRLKVYAENPQIINYSIGKAEEFIDLIIEITDTGIGISKEMREEIFYPFVQGQRQNIKKYGGTGLGLTITQRLVQLMEGTIDIDSRLKKGSSFKIKIPGVSYLRDFEKIAEEIQLDPADILFEKATIIVADDVEHNRQYLKDALRNTKIQIVEAEDGQQAFSLAKKIVPDLIITDIRMPVLDGFGLLNKLKSDDLLNHIPVIAYSASVMKAQRDRIRMSEFNGLLIKPVQVTELYIELMNSLPYKSTKAHGQEQSVSEISLIEEISDLPGLIYSLDTRFKDIWMTFGIRQPIGEVRDFGNQLAKLGRKHNAAVITGYGDELSIAADSFNIESILNLIRKYNVIVESLKSAKKMLFRLDSKSLDV
jgi:PAS domain S-box-containing protein